MRGLRILACFDVDHPAWSPTEIGRHLGLHKATAHRLVKALESEGFLSFDHATGKYHLGFAMLKAMYLLNSPEGLARMARPHMQRLSDTTGETVVLSTWTGQGTLIIDMVFTWRPFKPPATVGVTLTDLGNASGKLYVAFGPESQRAAWLSKPLERLTEYTIVDPRAMAEELDRVRREGVAYDLQENALGTCAVAAPIRDSTGNVRATFGIVAPVERFGPREMNWYAEAVKAAALGFSREFGYRGDPA